MTPIKTFLIKIIFFISVNSLAFIPLYSQQEKKSILKAPPRTEGEGPFDKMFIRGGILIDGTGAPPIGPVDIIIEGNRIVNIKSVGYPGVPIDSKKRPEVKPPEKYKHLFVKKEGFANYHFNKLEQSRVSRFGRPATGVRASGCGQR